MDPARVAEVCKELSDEEIIMLLFIMRERNAAAILESIEPARAARITRRFTQLSQRMEK